MTLPRSRLFLSVPDEAEPESAAACLAAAIQAGDIAAVRVRQRGSEEDMLQMISALKPITDAHQVALVLAGDPGLAKRMGADGVEVRDLAGLKDARARLGTGSILGAECGTSRHAAMELGEAGADYLGFSDPDGNLGDLIAWWAELFEVPCVALDPADLKTAGELARRGADFVRPADAMWTSPEAARAIVGETLHAMAQALK